MESTLAIEVEDHGVPTRRDTAYLRVIVHSTRSSRLGHSRVRPRSPALPPRPTAAAVVAVAIACCTVLLASLGLLLVVMVRRRKSHYKEPADEYQTYRCYTETITDSG